MVKILCLVFVIVVGVKTQEVVDPGANEDTGTLTEEDNLTNEIVADPLAVSDAIEPAIIPSMDEGEIGETTTSQENQPEAPAGDDEAASPDNVPDVPGENGEPGDAANEETLPDPPSEDDEIAITAANPETLPDQPGEEEEVGDAANPGAAEGGINDTNPPEPPAEDAAPLPTEQGTSENPPTTPADMAQTTPVVLPENSIPDRPFPSITISLPTFWPNTVISTNGMDTTRPADPLACKENEIYSCLPFCMRTCNNPMSKFLCRPLPNHFRLCRRGCICKLGYLLESPNGRCLSECPTRQLF